MNFRTCLVSSLMMSLASLHVSAAQVDVLHWWTSGGEAEAAGVFRNYWQALGNEWHDSAISGGGGGSAMTVLKSRALSATPPDAAQLKGTELREWANLGFLRNLDEIAQQEHWETILPPFVLQSVQFNGHYVATPTGIHRTNILWINPKILTTLKLNPPTTWAEFLQVAAAIQKAGYTPLAMSSHDEWQLRILFELLVLGEGGSDFYRHAMIELEPAALESATMQRILKTFHEIKQYTSDDAARLKWNQQTQLLIDGQAAMQIMGDWVKGEITAAKLIPNRDVICLPAPGTAGMFNYNIDSIAMFNTQNKTKESAQYYLAQMIMMDGFQRAFNKAKGSIPVFKNLKIDDFDTCAQQSVSELNLATKHNQLVPSADGVSNSGSVKQAFADILTTFFNDPEGNPAVTAKQLSRAVLSAKR